MYHVVLVVGNLGGDPEMRYLPNGTPVTNFSVATNRRWTSQDGEQHDETTWFRISAFGRQAEVCAQYLTKGRQVLVEGRLRPDANGGPRVWEAKDGSPRASFEVTANLVRFLGTREAADSEDEAPFESDEIPF